MALHASGLAEPEEVVLEELQVFKVSNGGERGGYTSHPWAWGRFRGRSSKYGTHC